MRKKQRLLNLSESYEHNHLQSELEQAQNELECAYSTFQNVIEPDLIDSTIYEINAIQIRYNFLLERARKSGFRVKP